MAINAYCGVMGSGKSYEVVAGPLLDAVAAGRRVVTNIDGISEERVHAHLVEKRNAVPDRLGAIVHVRTADLLGEHFFPTEDESPDGAVVTPGFVQPGDFLVIDEAWKLWAVGMKVTPEHMNFFRMHRHFVSADTGVSCDVTLMIQNIADLHRSVRGVLELSFVMVKLKSLGLSKKYRVEMYEGGKQTLKTRVGTFVRTYKSEIFPLYSSYVGGSGSEATIDKRQNVLANKTLWGVVCGVAVCMMVGAWGAWRFFHPTSKAEVSHAALPPQIDASPRAPGNITGPTGEATPASAKVSDTWRIAGSYRVGDLEWVVLIGGSGRMRIESPSMFVNDGIVRVGKIDGQDVTTWSGSLGGVVSAGGSR
ncbi:zonular occludens toxin domain-containing protein [Burkholderia lata]|uniref:zonular occludens toxin domain-containing protein n=1 Tax=Burkholderia lata (strain ATCC 17760 / DSM 23089 / LMG 22485 / NCIMB 9086 / R18194 / 383) TaxID=482957 RepID=UPI0015840176|nr:zonular occludens toxin domain-containing protein [Burkholderia lata]